MKIKFGWKDPEAADLIEIVGGKNDKWLLHSICEWRQFFGKWNWVDFHVIHLYFMNDVALPGFEISAILMGLGFRFRINGDWSTTEAGRAVQEGLDDIKNGRVGEYKDPADAWDPEVKDLFDETDSDEAH